MESGPSSGVSKAQTGVQWSWMWRGANLVMTVFFLLAGYVQLNDPDPYLWVPVYCVPSLLTLTVSLDPAVGTVSSLWRWLTMLAVGAAVGLASYQCLLIVELHRQQPLALGNPLEHEVGRELAGVAIVGVWLSICLRVSSESRQAADQSPLGMLIPFTALLAIFPLFFWSLCFVSDWHTKLGHCKDMFH